MNTIPNHIQLFHLEACRLINIDKVLAAEADVVELECALNEFDNRMAKLDSIQEQLEMTLPQEEIPKYIGKAAKAREEALQCCFHCLRALRLRTAVRVPANLNQGEQDETAGSTPASQLVKLPKLVLPKYGGDVLEWSTFWDQFQAAVDSSDLPDVS